MLKSFWSNRSGNYAIMLGITALPLLLSVGLATDYSRHVSAHRHLQELADAASLSLAGSEEKSRKILREMANEMIQSNRSDTRLENVKVVDVDADDGWVKVDLSGSIPTTFMHLANIERLVTRASATAERAITGSVEIALVLDNTHSMSYDDKIGALKEAAADLVDKLFDQDEANIRVGLVPYAEQINVGTRNRNAAWLSVPDDYSTTTTNTTEGRWHQPTKRTGNCRKWREAGSRRVEKDGVWVTETWGRSCQEWETVNDGPQRWVPGETTTETKDYKWHGCIGSRIDSGDLVLHDQSPSVKYPGFVTRNKTCLTEILPLTDDQENVEDAIDDMITSRDTYIPAGVIWGVNILSRSEPMEEAAAYDPANRKPRKVMVLMTDGLNTKRVNMSNGDYTGADSDERAQTNADTATACDYAKTQNIEIFTVAFKVDDANAKAMLLGCATDDEHYYDASDSEKLLAAFSGIAESLLHVRLLR